MNRSRPSLSRVTVAAVTALAITLLVVQLHAAPPDDSGGIVIHLETVDGAILRSREDKPVAVKVETARNEGVRYRMNLDPTDADEREIRRIISKTIDLDDQEAENEFARGLVDLAAVHPAVAKTGLLKLMDSPQPALDLFDRRYRREQGDPSRITLAMFQSAGIRPTPYACRFDARGPLMGRSEVDGPFYFGRNYENYFESSKTVLAAELQKPWVAARAESSLVLGHEIASKLEGLVFEPKEDARPRPLTLDERAELERIISEALKARNAKDAESNVP